MARTLRENNIQTIGQFASITPTALELIPYLKKPKLENALNFLRSYNPINFVSPTTPQNVDEMVVTEIIHKTPPRNAVVKVEDPSIRSLSPEHGAPIVGEQEALQTAPSIVVSKTLVDQAVQWTPQPSCGIHQTTSPIKTIYASVEQQTTPVVAKRCIEFDLEDDSVSELSSSQVGSVLKKKVEDLSRLVNDAFAKSHSKPNLSSEFSLNGKSKY